MADEFDHLTPPDAHADVEARLQAALDLPPSPPFATERDEAVRAVIRETAEGLQAGSATGAANAADAANAANAAGGEGGTAARSTPFPRWATFATLAAAALLLFGLTILPDSRLIRDPGDRPAPTSTPAQPAQPAQPRPDALTALPAASIAEEVVLEDAGADDVLREVAAKPPMAAAKSIERLEADARVDRAADSPHLQAASDSDLAPATFPRAASPQSPQKANRTKNTTAAAKSAPATTTPGQASRDRKALRKFVQPLSKAEAIDPTTRPAQPAVAEAEDATMRVQPALRPAAERRASAARSVSEPAVASGLTADLGAPLPSPARPAPPPPPPAPTSAPALPSPPSLAKPAPPAASKASRAIPPPTASAPVPRVASKLRRSSAVQKSAPVQPQPKKAATTPLDLQEPTPMARVASPTLDEAAKPTEANADAFGSLATAPSGGSASAASATAPRANTAPALGGRADIAPMAPMASADRIGQVGSLVPPAWPKTPYQLNITSTEGTPHRWTVGLRFNRDRLRIGEKRKKHPDLDATVILFPPGVDAPIPGTAANYDQKIGGVGIQSGELLVHSLDDKPTFTVEVMECWDRENRALNASATFMPSKP